MTFAMRRRLKMPKQYKESPKVKNAVKYTLAFYGQFLEDLVKMSPQELDALQKSEILSAPMKSMIDPIIFQSKVIVDNLNPNPLTKFMEGDGI